MFLVRAFEHAYAKINNVVNAPREFFFFCPPGNQLHRARTVVELVGLVGVHAELRFRRESPEEDLRQPGAGVRRSRVRGTGHRRDVLSLEPALSGYGENGPSVDTRRIVK